MERMLALIEEGICQANGPTKYLPRSWNAHARRAFGVGPGGSTSWDNRFDLGLQGNAGTRLSSSPSKKTLSRPDARTETSSSDLPRSAGQPTAGVQEAHESVVHGKEQIHLGEEAIVEARNAQKLTEDRMDANLPGVTYSEIVQSQQATAMGSSRLPGCGTLQPGSTQAFLLTDRQDNEMPCRAIVRRQPSSQNRISREA